MCRRGRGRVRYWVLVGSRYLCPPFRSQDPVEKTGFDPESPSLGQKITAVTAVVSVFWGGLELTKRS